jgi:hypothetical protein
MDYKKQTQNFMEGSKISFTDGLKKWFLKGQIRKGVKVSYRISASEAHMSGFIFRMNA